MKLEHFDFASGIKTLAGFLGLSIPYLDGKLIIGSWVFDIPDYLTAFLLTSEVVAFFTSLIVYGIGVKAFKWVKLLFPKK